MDMLPVIIDLDGKSPFCRLLSLSSGTFPAGIKEGRKLPYGSSKYWKTKIRANSNTMIQINLLDSA